MSALREEPAAARPLVSVLIPVAGESERIERCLDAVLSQTWPADRLEVLVVDGRPGDGTAEVARARLATRPDVRSEVLANPGGGRSQNLNVGLAHASGALVCRVDARSAVPAHHVSACAAALQDPAVSVVGGSQVAVAPGTGARAAGIARALGNPLALGMARYRRGSSSGAADTVYLGAFRSADVRAVGGWDEALTANEDFDLNRRLADLGVVWFDATLRVDYLPRASVRAVALQYWGFGRWKVRSLGASGRRPGPRQVVGLAVAPAAAVGAIAVARSHGTARAVAVGLALAALLGLEQVGAPPGPRAARPSERIWSLVTCAAVVGSWSLGGWFEVLVAPIRRPRR